MLWTRVLEPGSICLSICQALIFWEHTGESKFSLMNIYGKQPREQLQIPSFQMNSAFLRHVPKFIWAYHPVSSSCQVWNIHVLYSFLGPTSLFFLEKQGCSDWCWDTFFLSSTFDTHSLLLPLIHTTNVIQKTPVAFRSSFYPFSGKGHFLACLISWPEVHEVGRWFAVLPMKGVCLCQLVFPEGPLQFSGVAQPGLCGGLWKHM